MLSVPKAHSLPYWSCHDCAMNHHVTVSSKSPQHNDLTCSNSEVSHINQAVVTCCGKQGPGGGVAINIGYKLDPLEVVYL